jgi:hypothetical protein
MVLALVITGGWTLAHDPVRHRRPDGSKTRWSLADDLPNQPSGYSGISEMIREHRQL